MTQRTAEWHELRRTGVGSSDIPVLAGLSPYPRTWHDLYAEKLGLAEPQADNAKLEAGRRLEPVIRAWYAESTGRRVHQVHQVVRHPRIPHAIASLDGRVVGERRLVELKNTDNRRWSAGLPPDVECQVVWQLGVSGLPVADVAVLVAGWDLRVFEVQADPLYFGDLARIAGEFWRHVKLKTPPALDGSEGAARYLASLYPAHTTDALLTADPTLDRLVALYRQARDRADLAATELEAAKTAVKAALGEAPGVAGDGYVITWKRTADVRRVKWEAVATSLFDRVGMAAAEAAVAQYTEVGPGARRFVARFEGEDAA